MFCPLIGQHLSNICYSNLMHLQYFLYTINFFFQICGFLVSLSRDFSSYYSHVHILGVSYIKVDQGSAQRCNSINCGVMADVAVRKRHQQQHEIIIIFTRTILESAKFLCQYVRISYKRMLCETHAFMASAQSNAVRTGLR